MKHHSVLPGFALSSAIRAPTVENTSFARWIIVFALAVQAATALAKEIVVPRDFQTIQAAVDASAQGDVIKKWRIYEQLAAMNYAGDGDGAKK